MHEPAVRERILRFGPFEFDAHSGELRKGPTVLKVPYQPIEILKALLDNPGDLVTREQLRERLWPSDTFVDFEHGLNAAVRRLREALGDSADAPKYIETLPRRGYRFIATIESGHAVAIPQPVQTHRSRIGIAAAIVAVAALALWIAWPGRSRSSSATRVPPSSIPLTSFQGFEADPDLSPDGNQVAFVWQRDTDDDLNVYVMSVDSGEPVALTTNPANERSPTWSPDGSRIAFLRETRAGSAVVLIPALGGGEKIVTETQIPTAVGMSRSQGLAWAPDGASILIVDRTASGSSAIFSCSIATGERRQVTHPAIDAVDSSPAISPNGRYLAFVRGIFVNLGTVFVQQLDALKPTGEPRQLTREPRTWTLAWMPDSTRIVYEVGDRGGLWRVPIDGGSPEPVLTNVPATEPSISRDGRLVYQYNLTDSNIWQIPGPEARGRQESAAAPQRIVASTSFDSSPQFSPDGRRIAFVSGRTGDPEVWMAASDGSQQTRLTTIEGPFLGSPRWSPDQKRIVFDSRHSGHWNIYVVGVEDRRVEPITADTFINVRPSWSGDGRWIYFTSNRSGDEPQIWKVAATGGQPIKITSKGGFEAFESPDRHYLYYAKQSTPGIWRVPVQGGEEIQVLDRGRQMSWGLSQEGIALLDSLAKPAKVEFFRFDSPHTVAWVGELPSDARLARGHGYLTVSRDGQWVMYPRYDQWGSDIHRLQGSW